MKNKINSSNFNVKLLNILIFVVINTLIFSNYNCKDEQSVHDHSNHGKGHILPAGDAPEGSISELEGSWKTSENTSFKLNDMSGKLYILSMFYASCQSICPRIVSDIKSISKKIEESSGTEPNIVMVTFDPKNDTIESLAKYKTNNNLGKNWTFLRGTEEDIRMLAVALGVNYKQTSNGDFNHSAIINLISKDGYIVSRLEGVGANSDNLVAKYKKLK